MSDKAQYLQCPTTNYFGTLADNTNPNRETGKNPTPRVQKLRDRYFEAKSSASMEFPYWYTRKWEELEGDIAIIRRAESLRSGFEHLTPSIYPGELIAMGKANYLRGSYPMPWLSEAFFLAKEDDMYQEALEAGKVSSDEVTTMGQGGGNVTKSIGNV